MQVWRCHLDEGSQIGYVGPSHSATGSITPRIDRSSQIPLKIAGESFLMCDKIWCLCVLLLGSLPECCWGAGVLDAS